MNMSILPKLFVLKPKKLILPITVLLLVGLISRLSISAIANTPDSQKTNNPQYIESFTTHLNIEQDTSLSIKETIVFTTRTARHGIYRYIPLTRTKQAPSSEVKIKSEIKNISVTDQNNKPYQFEKSYRNQNLILKIGDPNQTFTGTKTYHINYTYTQALEAYQADGALVIDPNQSKQSPAYDELYWDITGEGWEFPILSSEVEVNSDWAKISDVNCYTGVYQSQQQDCTSQLLDSNQVSFNTDRPQQPGENFTILLKLDRPNQLEYPSWWQKNKSYIKQWLSLLGFIIPAAWFLNYWWKKGRDQVPNSPHILIAPSQEDQKNSKLQSPWPWKRQAIPFIYEPFSDLTPAQVGAISQEKIALPFIVAEILDLARTKFLKIDQKTTRKFWGQEKTEYTLHRTAKAISQAPEHQQFLLEKLFGNQKTVQLSKLKGTFYKHLEPFNKLVFESVVEQGYFANNPTKQRNRAYLWAAILIAITWSYAMFLVSTIFAFNPDRMIVLPLGLASVNTILILILAYHLPQKTVAGFVVKQKAKGLKRTIARGAWREEIKEKHLFIEEVLPFAVAFGVVNKLARDMAELGEKPPEYLHAISQANLIQFQNSFVKPFGTQLSYNPNSGSSAGGSGFSGGGFSGGGGGGGGGGSW